MARTALTVTTLARGESVSVSANAADATVAAADVANGNSIAWTGKEILIVRNDDAGAQTLTIDAAPDENGRDGAITDYSVGIGETAAFALFSKAWRQSDGTIHVDGSDANLKLAVLKVDALS